MPVDHEMQEVSVRQRLELGCRAVSLEFVTIFNEYLRRQVSESEFAELRTQDIVHGIGKNFQQDPAGWSIRGVTSVTKNTLADFVALDVAASETFVKKLGEIRSEMIYEGHIENDVKDLNHRELVKRWFGPADFFVSHAWMKEWNKLYEALRSPRSVNETEKEYRKREKERRGYFYWLDIFAVNQHSGDTSGNHVQTVNLEAKEDLEGLPKVVENVKKGLVLIFEPWDDPEVLRRAWCWAEIAAAVSNQRDVLLGFGENSAKTIDHILDSYNHRIEVKSREEYQKYAHKLLHVMKNLNAEESTCSEPKDKERIHNKLRAIGGTSFTGANRRMKYAIALLLLNAAKLRDRAQGRSETGSAVGLLKKLITCFKSGTKEHTELVNELSKQSSSIGKNEEALYYAKEAEKGLRKHIHTLPVLSGKGIDKYRFDNLLLLAEIQLRICRGYSEQFEKGFVEECMAYCNKALDTVRISSVMFESEHNMGAEEKESTQKRIRSIEYNANYHVIRSIALYYEWVKEKTRDREKDMEEVMKRYKAIKEIKKSHGPDSKKTGEYGASHVLYGKFLDAMRREGFLRKSNTFIRQLIMDKKLDRDDCTQDGIKKHFRKGINIQKRGYGVNSAKALMSYQSFGFFWSQNKKFKKALKYLRKALALDKDYTLKSSVPGLLGYVKDKECPANRPLYSFQMIIDAFEAVEAKNKSDHASVIAMQSKLINFFRVVSVYLEETYKSKDLRGVFADGSSRDKLKKLKNSCKRRVEYLRGYCEGSTLSSSHKLQEIRAELEKVLHTLMDTITKCKKVEKNQEFITGKRSRFDDTTRPKTKRIRREE